MRESVQLPFYVKIAQILLGTFTFFYILYVGQTILQPLLLAGILAILLNPLVNFLVRNKMNRNLAIAFAVIVTILVLTLFVHVILSQIYMFNDNLPRLKYLFSAFESQIIQGLSNAFHIQRSVIKGWMTTAEADSLRNMSGSIGDALLAINSVLLFVLIIPVYIFMILFYKNHLLGFIKKLFKTNYHDEVMEILHKSKSLIQSYLIGLLVEAGIIAVLNSAGLLVLGIDYAIILGVTGAILNVIPYIGGVMAIALPMIMAFVTQGPSSALFVLMIYLVIQFFDNHFIIPRIVASRVKINALISIIVVLVGNALWGVPGMFLSIPLTAILKVIFDHIESLKPLGYLLGNIVPTTRKYKLPFDKRLKSKKI